MKHTTPKHPPAGPMPASVPWWSILGYVLAFGVFFTIAPILLSAQVDSTIRDPNTIPSPRGSMILKLRLPANDPPLREVVLYPDGTLESGTIDAMYFRQKTHAVPQEYHLTAHERATLQAFQRDWCARTGNVFHVTTTTPAYGMGIWCGQSIEMVHIRVADLPQPLRVLVTQAFPDQPPVFPSPTPTARPSPLPTLTNPAVWPPGLDLPLTPLAQP
ncbi:MAG: hypothetical protein WCI67_00945 [Chloroflexales bacterium]